MNTKYTKLATIKVQDSPPEKRGKAVPCLNFT
jgi:hypothetical protein